MSHLNSQHPVIQSTMEMKKDQKIAFLNVQIEREGRVATSVFQNKARADRHINYNPHYHSGIKSGFIQCLGTQTKYVCHPSRFTTERQHLRQFFQANGYPTPEIDRILRNQLRPPPLQTEAQDQPSPYFPCVRGASERIE